MAKARAIPGLNEDDPYAAVAAKVVAIRASELAERSVGVLDTQDIEPLHDMRVATRRLRAALEVFEPCFPRKRFKAVLREVKDLADALGERRDRDVTIAALDGFCAEIGRADRRGVQSLITRVRDEQAEANLALAAYLSDDRLTGLAERLGELVAAVADRVAAPEPERAPPPAELPGEPTVAVSVNGGGAE
ncbi:MAG: CHAD domain-containing protein [Solirubrobacterales bacterium]